MKTALLRAGVAALVLTTAVSASAAGLLDHYTTAWSVAIATPEASAVAYNWDTHRLMVTNDEEDGNFARFGEYDMNGAKVADINLPGCLSLGSSQCDPEGLTYVGNGQYVVGEERYQDIARISQTAVNGTTRTYTDLSAAPTISVGPNAGNTGLEGVAYDRTSGDFYAVKETGPQTIWKITNADFGNETATISALFDIGSLGLDRLSDIAVLSNGLFAATAFGDNLLILSGRSQVIYELSQTGQLISQFDLSGFDALINPLDEGGKFEGMTLDEDGNIYLVSDDGDGRNQSYLVKLQYNALAAVPEPASWAMMVGGFSLVGVAARRRRRVVVA